VKASTLIVIAYHGDAWIPDCIQTLSNQLPEKLHLVLVDNFGNTEIDRIDLSAFDAELLKTEKSKGFAEANNFAMITAEKLGEYIVFLNQDTKAHDDCLQACMDCLESNPDIAAVTPMTRTYDWQGWDPYFLECAKKSEAFSADFERGGELARFYETPVIPAAAMVVRRSVLEKVGPFDPIYGSYYEDYDLCHRMRKAGYLVGVCTTAAIAHYSGSATNSEAAERRRARWVTRNRVIFRQRKIEGGVLSMLKHWLGTFPRGLGRSLLHRPASKPIIPYLLAHSDLLRLTPRLVSRRYDETCWQRYLASIGWPPHPSRGI
jgi:GT2 family glycosyltransferase